MRLSKDLQLVKEKINDILNENILRFENAMRERDDDEVQRILGEGEALRDLACRLENAYDYPWGTIV